MKFEVKIDENEAKIVEATGAHIAAKDELGNLPHAFVDAKITVRNLETEIIRKFQVSEIGSLKMENCEELKT